MARVRFTFGVDLADLFAERGQSTLRHAAAAAAEALLPARVE